MAGTQAFTGQGTWVLSPFGYADMLGGPSSGNLYFPTASSGNVGSATLIGEWALATSVPEPLTLMGASAAVAFGAAFKRKKKA